MYGSLNMLCTETLLTINCVFNFSLVPVLSGFGRDGWENIWSINMSLCEPYMKYFPLFSRVTLLCLVVGVGTLKLEKNLSHVVTTGKLL